jgi:iron complex transport system substrate-binding protein
LKTSSITLILFLLLFSSAGGFGAQNAYPKRIISLAPSITKSLYLLGAQDRLIAVTIYCPPEASSKEKIGTVYEPNIEKIVSLSPDLVIIAKEGNLPQTMESLKKLGINIYIVESANNFSEICTVFLALARVVGSESEAQNVIEQSKKRLDALKNSNNTDKPSVFWQLGAQPLITVSGKSFVNEFIELAGGKNIFSDINQKYPQISLEEVVRKDPDVIIMVTMADITADEKAKWMQFHHLKAVKNNRIYLLNDPLFANPTPKAIADGAEIVAKLLGTVH